MPITLRRFSARRFRGPMARGLNAPFLVSAIEEGSDELVSLVVKCHAGYDDRPECLVREMFALILARELGLATVEPVVVDLPEGFEYGAGDYKSHRGRNYPEMIEQSRGWNFATVHLGADWKQWLNTAPPQSVGKEEINAAFSYDGMVQNADRQGDNPNLLWREDRLVLLDFDKAFAYCSQQGGEEKPWRKFLPMMQLERHCLFPFLKQGEGGSLCDWLWEHWEEWQLERGCAPITEAIETGLASSPLDFAEILTYLSKLAGGMDDFFGYLTAHAKPS